MKLNPLNLVSTVSDETIETSVKLLDLILNAIVYDVLVQLGKKFKTCKTVEDCVDVLSEESTKLKMISRIEQVPTTPDSDV